VISGRCVVGRDRLHSGCPPFGSPAGCAVIVRRWVFRPERRHRWGGAEGAGADARCTGLRGHLRFVRQGHRPSGLADAISSVSSSRGIRSQPMNSGRPGARARHALDVLNRCSGVGWRLGGRSLARDVWRPFFGLFITLVRGPVPLHVGRGAVIFG